MTTHNGERFIEAQLRSILGQSFSVSEVILSDDDSRDETLNVVDQVVSDGSTGKTQVHVTTNSPALGTVPNFESAIRKTSGDLILLADQDDVWSPHKVERLVRYFDEHPSKLLVFTNARNIDADGAYLGHTLFEALELTRRERKLVAAGRAYEALLRRNLATGATVMFRRELYELAKPFPQGWLHDEWLAIVAAAHNEVGMLDECLIDYRQHGSNQVGMDKLTLRDKFAKLGVSFSERNQKLLVHARVLHEFAESAQGISAQYRDWAAEKYRFEQARERYPRARIRRLPHILRQYVAGNYRRFSTGFKDAVRNLVQPE